MGQIMTATEIRAKMLEADPVCERARKSLEKTIDTLITHCMKVIISHYASVRVQFRFPKSKRRRIRKKWAKREENFRLEPKAFIINGDTLVAHTSIERQLRDQLVRDVDDRVMKEMFR